MPKGGARKGAGRKLNGLSPAKSRTIRINDEQWELINQLAKDSGLSTTQYILRSAIPQQETESLDPQQ